jgi:hypothetical protein
VTVPISANSTRRYAAREFGLELNRAMKARGIGRRRLAELMGMKSASIIAWWRAGEGLPRLENAVRLAECLDWDRLVAIVSRVRELPCDNCGNPFVNEGGGPKRYCSERCREVKAKVRAGGTSRGRADVAERALVDHRAAVAAMCRGCEPEGRCHQQACALRPVSPLPLLIDLRPGVRMATPETRTIRASA